VDEAHEADQLSAELQAVLHVRWPHSLQIQLLLWKEQHGRIALPAHSSVHEAGGQVGQHDTGLPAAVGHELQRPGSCFGQHA